MASKKYCGVTSQNPSTTLVCGSFTTDGSGVATLVTGSKHVAVTKPETGVYRITFSQKFPTILFATAQVLKATDDVDVIVQLKTMSATYVEFFVLSADTPAAADLVSSTMTYMIVAKNTSVR